MFFFQYEEVKISLENGFIAGKWYGSKESRPILCLHGADDSAGTFDRLAPLLLPEVSLLAIDSPGNGMSSSLPKGVVDHDINLVLTCLQIMKHFGWEKISLMGHSLGGFIAFIMSALFPTKVDMVIALDAGYPAMGKPKHTVDMLAMKFGKLSEITDIPPSSYTLEECIEKQYLGTRECVEKACCKYILDRKIKPSATQAGKFQISRDIRSKFQIWHTFPEGTNIEFARRIKAPYLAFCMSSEPFRGHMDWFHEAYFFMEKNNPNFTVFKMDGSHYTHLNEPERLAGIINDFIKGSLSN